MCKVKGVVRLTICMGILICASTWGVREVASAPGVHLRVELYDKVDGGPTWTFDLGNEIRAYGVNLNQYDAADKAARVVVRKGPAYHPGDHVLLRDELNEATGKPTDMVSVDPEVQSDVNLNEVNFADKAAQVDYRQNPHTSYRIRVDLYDTVGQPYPDLSLYDWEQDRFLYRLHFADKAARVVVAPGESYHPGDHVRLLDGIEQTGQFRGLNTVGRMVSVDPQVQSDVDLNAIEFADKAQEIQWKLNPNASYLARVDLYDTVGQPYPDLSLYDWQFAIDGGIIDLNSFYFADKTAAIRLVVNASYPARVDLYDTVGQPYPNLSLYDWQFPTGGIIDLNSFDFADKTAAIGLVLNQVHIIEEVVPIPVPH